jgi:hypothetical protein
VSESRREKFPAPSLHIVSENVMLTELKRVDPDSRQIGILAIAALSAVTGKRSDFIFMRDNIK